ncbi:hypothetical protein X798_05806 [Onchocerca flexuosa]|uniref:Uncharacterized protein n=1 Tax=Onchocerca flexuosa TaxID=387005 RepID=A0A238BR77_9BILA|nr:hypothetical protein X798_05806 [Onchocerca flexuosa]
MVCTILYATVWCIPYIFSIIAYALQRASCKKVFGRNSIPEKVNDDNNNISSMKSTTIAGSTTTTSNVESLPVDFSSIDEFSCSTPKKKALKVDELKTKVDSLPVDLRLGLKLRLESPKRFFWLEKSKRFADYDDAIKLFCSLQTETNEIEATGRSISNISKFLACTLYWQFPDLAWQPSFPRFDNDSRLITGRKPAVPSLHTLGDSLVQALTMQWFLSFEQLYHSWRFGKRSYFYACCPTYTILFWKTSKGIVEVNENLSESGEKYNFRVVITPTSYGFRQQLREEGNM